MTCDIPVSPCPILKHSFVPPYPARAHALLLGLGGEGNWTNPGLSSRTNPRLWFAAPSLSGRIQEAVAPSGLLASSGLQDQRQTTRSCPETNHDDGHAWLGRGVQLGTHNRSEVAYNSVHSLCHHAAHAFSSTRLAYACRHHIVVAGSVHREVDAIAYLSPA